MPRWTSEQLKRKQQRNPHLQVVGAGKLKRGPNGPMHAGFERLGNKTLKRPENRRTCKSCGADFYAWPSKTNKYCSLRCAYDDHDRVSANPQSTKKIRGTAVCIGCGTEFEKRTRGGKWKFCSQSCAGRSIGKTSIRQAQAKRAVCNPELKMTFACETCGTIKTVYKNSGNQNRFCSILCANRSPSVKNKAIATRNSKPQMNTYSRCARGWVTVGGRDIFVKSQWEANYAFYLQFLKEHGQITEWEYETTTFWFEKIKRGVRSYLPDFKVSVDGRDEYHEVKGWMDSKSKTKLNRMRIHHPAVLVVVRDASWFKWANKSSPSMIPGWGVAPSVRSKSRRKKSPKAKKGR